MKKILTITACMLYFSFLFGQSAQSFWQQIEHEQVFLPERSETSLFPSEYIVYKLDVDEMANHLRQAPFEGSPEAMNGTFKVSLPMADGTFEEFAAWESPVMHPDLAEKYPMIKTFAGRSISNPAHTARFGYGPAGFHVVIPSENGGAITERYATYQDQYYITYHHSNFLLENVGFPVLEYIKNQDEEEPVAVQTTTNNNKRGGGDGALTERRDYLFVLACTGEFGQMHGSDVPTVLGTLVEALNAMNGLLERDIDVRFTMHPNNDQVVFVNPASDPFINANMGGALLGQNEDLLNNIIGTANFDVGHVYTGGCSDVGGVVSGTVCAQGKARGVTCNFSSNVIATTLSIAAHEIMHQFSGGHTFNHCPGNEGQFSSSSAWEPGSGSTILSYQGACGASNIPGPATIQYHVGNVDEVWSYTHFQGGAVCTNINTTSNHSPVITENYTDGFSIPLNTPFELEVSATDEDGDPLTYSWEQMNRTPSAPLGSPFGDAPTFRVYDHNSAPIRYFPRLQTILNNSSEVVEILPNFEKNMRFRCMVRDNNITEGAGGVSWADVEFKASETAGPFLVTHPNSGADVWTAGEQVEITWDVANTDNDIIKCNSVNVYLSTNGGNTFDNLLLASTPNDGSEIITVPDFIGSGMRLKIKAADNIFFDVSNSNFEIKAAAAPFYSLNLFPEYQRSCVPDASLIEVGMNSFSGYDQPVDLAIVDGLPDGAQVNFSQNPVQPGESVVLEFNMDDVTDIGLFEMTLRAISDNDTTYRSVFLDVVFNDFSALALEGPIDGDSGYGLQPSFVWSDLPHADIYDFQLSTSPLFTPDDILVEIENMVETEYIPDFALSENTLYYWRVRPSNICGKGDYSLKSIFQTFTTDCTPRKSTDIPKPISAIGLPVVESSITVLESGIISDINIRDLKGTHDALADLRVSLVSPEETEVVLFENICGNVTTFNLNLDDESPFDFDCPPLGGLSYKPQNPLSTFDNENTLGNWTLKVAVINEIGAGGVLQDWTVEFCASVDPEHPFLLENDTIYVQPNDTQVIHNYELFAGDPDNHASELKVTIIDETKHGYISKNGVQLGVGDFFRFTDINDEIVTYTNTNPDEDYDFFTFSITDGQGGLLATPKFNIVIDPDAVTDVSEVQADQNMILYPNPASDKLNILFKTAIPGDMVVRVTDVQGRLLDQQKVFGQSDLLQVDLNGLSDGLYLMSVQTEEGVFTEKFLVQH